MMEAQIVGGLGHQGIERRIAGEASPPPDGRPLYSIVRAEIGAPSTIAHDKVSPRRRPPRAEALKQPLVSVDDLTVNEDLPGRRRPLRREAITFDQAL
jgi:hypothetical protein